MIGVARLLLAAILVTGSMLSWPSFSVEQPIPVTKRPPASSSMPVRPFPDAVVRQNPPDFSWPVATGVGNYEVLLRFPDGKQQSRTTDRNWLNWPTTLPPGQYQWSVRSATGSHNDLVNARFSVPDDTLRFVVPSADELLRHASNVERPRLLPKGDELARLKAALYGARRPGWDKLLDRVRKSVALAPTPEPAALPNRITDYVNWARELNRTGNVVRSETKMLQEAIWAWMVTRDPEIGRSAVRRANQLATWNPTGVSSYSSNDQMTRDIAISLAMARDGLDELLSAKEKRVLVSAAQERINDILGNIRGILRNMERAPHDSHGYSALFVVASSAALLAGEGPSANATFKLTIPWLINAISPWGGEDGGFSNGTAYAIWSLEYFVPAWDILKRSTGVDIGEKAWSRGFAEFLAYAAPPGSPGNIFGDGFEQPLTRHLAKRFSRRSNTDFARWYERQTFAEDDSYLWLINAVPQSGVDAISLPSGTPNAKLFPDIGWAAMHSSLPDRSRTSIYFKSSRFGSYNHAHAEHNSFVVHSAGKVLTGGSGYYDPYGYYGTKHWKNWYQQTRAHNAITFDDGQGQLTQRLDAGGEIVAFHHSAEIDFVTGNATDAYGGLLTKALRTIAYVRDNQIVVVDQLASNQARRWEWNIHAFEKFIERSLDQIEIKRDSVSICVSQLSGPATRFEQTDQFSEKPDKEGYAPQWHGAFLSKEKLKSADFIFVLNVGCTGEPVRLLEQSATAWKIELGTKRITVQKDGRSVLGS